MNNLGFLRATQFTGLVAWHLKYTQSGLYLMFDKQNYAETFFY